MRIPSKFSHQHHQKQPYIERTLVAKWRNGLWNSIATTLNMNPEQPLKDNYLQISTRDGSGVGIVLKSPEETVVEQAVRLGFSTSNNESEYEALIVGLKKAKLLGTDHLIIHYNSQLVANQLTREYAARNQRMRPA